jgi:hypothetical protein
VGQGDQVRGHQSGLIREIFGCELPNVPLREAQQPRSGRAPARQQAKLAKGAKDKEHAMPQKLNSKIAVIGIDIGENSFHVVGHDQRGAICCGRSGRAGK